jgi:hypothetical protein
LQAVKYIPISGIGKSDLRHDTDRAASFYCGMHIYAREVFNYVDRPAGGNYHRRGIICAAVHGREHRRMKAWWVA